MRILLLICGLALGAADSAELIWKLNRVGRGGGGREATLTQVSTLDALLRGLYGASYTVGQLKESGDFGVGTYEGLDGELIALDGKFYQFRADGRLTEADDSAKVPFITLTRFRPDVQFSVRGVTQAQLGELVDSLIPTKNHFYAIKVSGKFQTIQTRSIAKQFLPYPPLGELIPGQALFNYSDIAGVAVGVRSPAFVAGLNQTGHHFHFVSEDKKAGGHSLNFTIAEATLEIQQIRRHTILLPDDEPFRKAVLPVE
jgi:acetolactate decarboxylase